MNKEFFLNRLTRTLRSVILISLAYLHTLKISNTQKQLQYWRTSIHVSDVSS